MPDFDGLIRAARSPEDTAALVSRLTPARADRTDPVAREWVRRWAPARMGAATAECGCAIGRCGVCN